MLKSSDPVKIERQALEALRKTLAEVPEVELVDILSEPEHTDRPIDLIAHLSFHGQPTTLVAQVKSSGQPRHVQTALFQLQRYVEGGCV